MCAGAEREKARIPQGGGANRRKDATCARSHPFRQRDEPSRAQDVFAAANDKYLSRQHPRARCFPFAEGAAHCESVQFDNNCVLGLNAVTWKSTALNRAWLELGALSKQN